MSSSTRSMWPIWLIILAGLLGLSLISLILYLYLIRQRENPIKAFEQIKATKYANLYDFILAQSRYETGNFTSSLFLNFHNLFGMKNATVRSQLGSSKPDSDFRFYRNYSESVRDFLLYLDSVNFPMVTNLSNYIAELKARSYFEADVKQYYNGVNYYS